MALLMDFISLATEHPKFINLMIELKNELEYQFTGEYYENIDYRFRAISEDKSLIIKFKFSNNLANKSIKIDCIAMYNNLHEHYKNKIDRLTKKLNGGYFLNCTEELKYEDIEISVMNACVFFINEDLTEIFNTLLKGHNKFNILPD